MEFRFLGLIPAFAVLAAAGSALAVTPSNTPAGGGSMAYPTPLPSGEVTVPNTVTHDNGGSAYPSSGTGGATETESKARDTGAAAYPGGGSPPTVPFKRRSKAVTTASKAPSAATPVAVDKPTPQGMAAARSLANAPGSAPVPYVDFAPGPDATKTAGTAHTAKPAAKKPSA